MVCYYCGNDTRVTNSRLQLRTNNVWRRRKCLSCGATFTSIETTDWDSLLRVQQRNGTHTPFSRDSLFLSLYDACSHRKAAIADTTALTDTVCSQLLKLQNKAQIESLQIAAVATEVLSRFDTAAATRYSALHPLS